MGRFITSSTCFDENQPAICRIRIQPTSRKQDRRLRVESAASRRCHRGMRAPQLWRPSFSSSVGTKIPHILQFKCCLRSAVDLSFASFISEGCGFRPREAGYIRDQGRVDVSPEMRVFQTSTVQLCLGLSVLDKNPKSK